MASSKMQKTHGKAHDHSSEIARVRKVIGQLEGIENMILEKRQPSQIIQQVKAASSALTALRFEILKRHMQECLKEAATSGNNAKLVEQILESVQMQVNR